MNKIYFLFRGTILSKEDRYEKTDQENENIWNRCSWRVSSKVPKALREKRNSIIKWIQIIAPQRILRGPLVYSSFLLLLSVISMQEIWRPGKFNSLQKLQSRREAKLKGDQVPWHRVYYGFILCHPNLRVSCIKVELSFGNYMSKYLSVGLL